MKYPEFWFLLAAALFLPPFGKNPGILLVMLLNSSVFVREIKGVKKNSIVVFACGIYFFVSSGNFRGVLKLLLFRWKMEFLVHFEVIFEDFSCNAENLSFYRNKIVQLKRSRQCKKLALYL